MSTNSLPPSGGQASGPTALIVGAGIGGLAAGIALRDVGWNVRVYERATDPRELGFALLLAPNALAALRRLGLADRVIAGGARVGGGDMRRTDGRLLRSFAGEALAALVPEPAVVALRPVLHGTLLETLGREALVLGSGAVGFEHRGDGVTLVLADGREAHGDVLIGADGARSVVRKALRPEEGPPRSSGLFALRGVAHGLRMPQANRSVQYFGRGLEVGVATANEDSIYWYVSMTANYVSDGSRDPASLAQQVIAGGDAFLQTVVESTRADDMRIDELFERDPIREWGDGRVTLLGDAAHAMLPHAGQGAAQALEDAVTLSHVLKDARIPEAGLRRYEQIRFERTRDVMRTARRNARLASVRSPVGCWLRDSFLSIVPESVVAKAYVAFAIPPELS